MKITTDNAIYVQKNDIAFLNQTDMPVPASIFMQVFGQGIVIIDDSNRFEFEKFEDASAITFFKEQDWIVDYNAVKDLKEEEFIELGQSIVEEKRRIAEKFNQMTIGEQQNHYDMVTQCELLDFKIYSLRDILWLKQGRLKMQLPEEVEASSSPKETASMQEKGIQKFLKRVFPTPKK